VDSRPSACTEDTIAIGCAGNGRGSEGDQLRSRNANTRSSEWSSFDSSSTPADHPRSCLRYPIGSVNSRNWFNNASFAIRFRSIQFISEYPSTPSLPSKPQPCPPPSTDDIISSRVRRQLLELSGSSTFSSPSTLPHTCFAEPRGIPGNRLRVSLVTRILTNTPTPNSSDLPQLTTVVISHSTNFLCFSVLLCLDLSRFSNIYSLLVLVMVFIGNAFSFSNGLVSTWTHSNSRIRQHSSHRRHVITSSTSDEETRCGFVSLLGPSNTGKSTLLNTLMGTKVAIVSPKVQTTRCRVIGIHVEGTTQVVFQDTPGIFDAQSRLDRAMVKAAWTSSWDADAVVLVLDAYEYLMAGNKLNARNQQVIDTLRSRQEKGILAKVLLAVNKIDKLDGTHQEETCSSLTSLLRDLYAKAFLISATRRDGISDLSSEILSKMPVGPFLYPEEDLTDMPLRLMAAEITREQIFLQLRQEVPYSTSVETIKWKDLRDGTTRIEQNVYVERDSQKGILMGVGGRQIKSIGVKAREEIEELVGHKVHLFLFVKHRPNWKQEASSYSPWGLEFDA